MSKDRMKQITRTFKSDEATEAKLDELRRRDIRKSYSEIIRELILGVK